MVRVMEVRRSRVKDCEFDRQKMSCEGHQDHPSRTTFRKTVRMEIEQSE